ncbi:mechanosensitive channel protein [Pokkaliibacter sp. CJK22405]|uniref:mechanosensitive channel protein n=1 Tax=Pokkaliibacter sp. CJK22405 TaxID=3384615 RepID=UPI003984BBF8
MTPPSVKARAWLSSLLFLCMTLFAMPGLAAESSTTSAEGDKASYTELANLLENDKSRDALIQTLRNLADNKEQPASGADASASDSSNADAATAAASSADNEPGLPRQLANSTKALLDNIGSQLSASADSLSELTSGNADSGINWTAVGKDATKLGLTIVAAFATFLVLRLLGAMIYRKIDLWLYRIADPQYATPSAPLLRKTAGIIGATLLDGVIVILAYMISNAITLALIGHRGTIDTQSSLFLNGFVLIELFKVILRLIFSPRFASLRLMPMSTEAASKWGNWLALMAGFIGYTILVIVPILKLYELGSLGQILELVVMTIALVYALIMIIGNRKEVADGILDLASNSQMGVTQACLRILARTWFLIAVAYVVGLFLVTQLRPDDALPFMAAATIKSLICIGVGLLLSSLLGHFIGHRITLSEEIRRKVPLLENRINSYIPAALRVVRLILMAIVIILVMNAWALFDTLTWIKSEEGAHVIASIVHVALILLFAALIWLVTASVIEHKLNPETGGGAPSARVQTLLGLFRNALAIIICTMTVLIVLSEIGIDIGPLIAGAGVLGLAIGFGAQKLVQDIITGVFIQLENTLNTGDVVTAGGVTGTAERLTIRSVGIRDLNGTYHLVPFSSVDTISNYMKGFGYHVGEYGVAYREDTDEVLVHLQNAFDELMEDTDHNFKILEPLEVHGVTALADSSVNVRVRIKTRPGDQWGVGRAYNRLVKRHLDAAGIEIPFPHMTVYFGEDKEGKAPPANLRFANGPLAKEDAIELKAESKMLEGKKPPVREEAKPVSGEDFNDAD